jgi:hypothetical protein
MLLSVDVVLDSIEVWSTWLVRETPRTTVVAVGRCSNGFNRGAINLRWQKCSNEINYCWSVECIRKRLTTLPILAWAATKKFCTLFSGAASATIPLYRNKLSRDDIECRSTVTNLLCKVDCSSSSKSTCPGEAHTAHHCRCNRFSWTQLPNRSSQLSKTSLNRRRLVHFWPIQDQSRCKHLYWYHETFNRDGMAREHETKRLAMARWKNYHWWWVYQ